MAIAPTLSDTEIASISEIPHPTQELGGSIYGQTKVFPDYQAEKGESYLGLVHGIAHESSVSLVAVLQAIRPLTPRLVVLGGGGYNPWTVGRCWAALWGTLNDRPIPSRLPDQAEAVLRALRFDRAAGRNPPTHWFTTLRDAPRDGPVRDEVKRLAELAMKEKMSV